MSFKKVIFTSLVAVNMSSISALAYADLVIQNNTNQPSTSSIKGNCSSMLGKTGITEPHSRNVIKDSMIRFICGPGAKTCLADVYMTRDCGSSGKNKMATMELNLDTGAIAIKDLKDGYHVTTDKFYAQVDGGPAKVS